MRITKIIGQWALTLLLLLVGLAPAAAQDTAGFVPYQRLVMLGVPPRTDQFAGYGDIYSWVEGDGEWFQETYYGYNFNLAMSPDGTKVVYLSLPQEFVDGVISVNRQPEGGPPPANIWLMDLTTAQDDPARFLRIADQVNGLPSDTDPGYLQRRSMPVWSPDSTQLAWIELDKISTSFRGRIVVYDIRTNTSQVASTEVAMGYSDAGEWNIPDLLGWGSAIANMTVNAGVYEDQEGGGFGFLLEIFSPEGEIAQLPISYFANWEDELSFTQVRWVLHRDQWRLALHYPNLGWVVLDAANATYEQLSSPPFIRAITGVGWTGQLVSTFPLQISWQADQPVPVVGDWGIPLTFTPKGVPIWISDQGQLVTVVDDGIQPVLPFSTGDIALVDAAWTPALWMTDGQGTPISPQISQ